MEKQFVYNRRLLKLAEFLEKLPPKRFYYGSWCSYDFSPSLKEEKNVCGTTACAGGWAATMPTFKRLGLRLDVAASNVVFKKRGAEGTTRGRT